MGTVSEINLFNDDNRQLQKCFFFFFVVAVCGYLSLMISFCPYSDDYWRYVENSHIGTISAVRTVTFILENFVYLSGTITDASPFTQLLSCAFLAYTAVLCLKIFGANLQNKLEVLCFAPVVVNPYLLEVMAFRFDNPFTTLSLLFTSFAAYLSSLNNKKWLLHQTTLLIFGLFTYQPSLFAYLIVLAYLFIVKMRSGRRFLSTIFEMRYWFYALLSAACFYFPFTYFLTYSSTNSGDLFLVPKDAETIAWVLKNISMYFSAIYADWSINPIGQIFFGLLAIFSLNTLTKTWNNTKSVVSVCIVSLGILALLLSPAIICMFMHVVSFEGNTVIFPRIMYSVGILISLILFDNCNLFSCSKGVHIFYNCLTSVFCLWSIVFLNSAGNVIHCYRILQHSVSYDMAKDVSELTNRYQKIDKICVIGAVDSPAMHNFVKLYPIVGKIVPEAWNIPDYCRLALINLDFLEKMLPFFPADERYVEANYSNKKLIKRHMLYDIYLLDNHLLLFSLKKEDRLPIHAIARIH